MRSADKNTLVPFSARSPKEGTAAESGLDPEPAVWTIRRRWNQDVSRHCQEFMACFLPDGPIPTEERIAAFFRQMPAPVGPGEAVLLQSILMQLAFSIWTSAVPAPAAESERADRRSRGALTRPPSIGPRWDSARVAEWAAVFGELIAQVWPRWAALRAAALLTGRFVETWAPGRLAAEVHCDAARLDAEFRRQFGVPARGYLRRLRVRAAIDMLAAGMKVECVPSAVGYRSRKNLNRALERLTGLRPSEVRHLTAEQIASVHRRLSVAASSALLPSAPARVPAGDDGRIQIGTDDAVPDTMGL